MVDKNIEKSLFLPNHNVIIEGCTVLLKPISQNEINERYLSWLHDPETTKFLEVRHVRESTVETIYKYINSLRSRGGCELFAVFTKRGHVHVGNVSISEYNSHGQGYVIYGIMIGDQKARMMGMGGEANLLLIEYLFKDPLIRRIQAGVCSDNEKSWKMVETMGFQREAVLREHVVLPSGRINDFYWYGLLRNEWNECRLRSSNILNRLKITDIPKKDI